MTTNDSSNANSPQGHKKIVRLVPRLILSTSKIDLFYLKEGRIYCVSKEEPIERDFYEKETRALDRSIDERYAGATYYINYLDHPIRIFQEDEVYLSDTSLELDSSDDSLSSKK